MPDSPRPSDHSDHQPKHRASAAWGFVIQRIPGAPFNRIHVAPLAPTQELIGVIDGHGKFVPMIASTRAIGPSELWGCAICEGLHTVEQSGCPLVGHRTRDVVIGPYEVNGIPTYMKGQERDD